jgi:hypothetical protein
MPNINASSLPEKPDLAQERKRAKDLLKALRSHERDAIADRGDLVAVTVRICRAVNPPQDLLYLIRDPWPWG